jgi:Na+/H+-dicarboxylate symporter
MSANEGKKKKGILSWYFQSNLLLRILIGLVLGAVVGLIAGPAVGWLKPFGDLFVRLLKMIVMPVIFTTLVVGAASISPARLGRVGIKIIIFYLLTSAVAVAIGLLAGNLFHPGLGLNLGGGEAAGRELVQPKLVDTLLNIVPTNPFGAIASGQVLPVIFFAIIFGIGVSYLMVSKNERIKKAGTTVLAFFEGAAEVMYLVVRWVLQYAP